MSEEWVKCQKVILGYLIAKQDVNTTQVAVTQLKEKYFSGDLKGIWKTLSAGYLKKGFLLNVNVFRELARSKRLGEESILKAEMIMEDCVQTADGVSSTDINWYMGRIGEAYRETQYRDSLEKGLTVIAAEGFAPARDYMLKSLTDIEDMPTGSFIDGDVKEEIASVVEEARGAKEFRKKFAVDLGIRGLDREIVGLREGDICLIAAAQGTGKTAMMVNIAVDVVFRQKKNLVFVTTETVRTPVRRRIVSRLSKYGVFDTPVKSKNLKSGDLTPEELATLEKMKDYLANGAHGAFILVQAPADANLSWLRGKLLQCENKTRIDLCILDDLRNMKPMVRRRTEWEEYNELFKDFKAIARTHAGRGVPMVSPYQMSRDAQRKADENVDNKGSYDLTGLSSSSEAEKTSDIVISLWSDPQIPGDMKAEILKMRDGRSRIEVKLKTDFEYQLIEEAESSAFDEED